MEIHTTTTRTSNGWYGGVRYDTPNGLTHCLGRHGWPSEQDADRYAKNLAKRVEDEERAIAEVRRRTPNHNGPHPATEATETPLPRAASPPAP